MVEPLLEVGPPMREAWYAVLLSYFVPGLGHAYAGRFLRGAIFLVPFVTLIGVSAYLVAAPGANPGDAIGVLGLVTAIYLAAMFDALRTAQRVGVVTGGEAPPSRPRGKDPWLAGVLSYVMPGLLVPGAGQIYGGKRLAGLLFLVPGGVLSGFLLMGRVGAWGFPTLHLLRIAALIHAVRSVGGRKTALPRMLLLLMPLIVAEATLPFATVWAMRNVLRVHKVRGSAMDPEYRNADYVLVPLTADAGENPRRDDVVYYEDDGEGFLGRVVVLPGEVVEVRGGKLRVKGEPVGQLRYVIPDGEWGTMSIPPGKVLVLTDRQRLDPEQGLPEPLDANRILGRVTKRLFPFERPEEPPRPDPTRAPPRAPPASGDGAPSGD